MCRTTSVVCLRHPVHPETSTVKSATTTKKKSDQYLKHVTIWKPHESSKYTALLETIKNKSVEKFRTTSSNYFRYQPTPTEAVAGLVWIGSVEEEKVASMAFTLYSLIQTAILCTNAIAVLHEERFLSKSEYNDMQLLKNNNKQTAERTERG